MVWQAVGAIIGLAGSAYSADKADEGAGKAKDAGRLSSSFIKEETTENLRRKSIADMIASGQGRATLAASGLRGSGSSGDYLDFLDEERKADSAWTLRAGILRADAARAGADITAQGLENQSTLYALQGVQQFVSTASNTIT